MCCSRLTTVVVGILVAVAGCTRKQATAPTTVRIPTASVQPGACGDPSRDGVVSESPQVEHADRDLDGDGQNELVVVDRAKCDETGNCYWNVFRQPTQVGECIRYAGTFAGANLETLASRGEDSMSDVRAYWKQSGGRLLLQSYRFIRDGYRIEDVLQCKRATDDRLECAETNR